MTDPLLDTSALPRFREISSEGTVPALKSLLKKHRQQLQQLLNNSDSFDFQSLVMPLEEMSHELNRVWSPVNHLQSVLDHIGWRDAYTASLPLLTEYATELSQNSRLQQAFEQVAENLPANASEAERSLIEQALRDFRLAGVALDEESKEEFRNIMQELSSAQAAFGHNVQDAANGWSWFTDDEDVISGLPRTVLDRARNDAREESRRGWLFRLDFPTYHAVITHADNRDVRHWFYKAWATRASDEGDPQFDNSKLIQCILRARKRAANLVGFSSFSEYSLATKMAASTDEVLEFIRELASKTMPAARKEFDAISAMADHPLEAWDVAWCLEKLKQRKYSVSDDELRQYFPSRKVLEGMFELAETLYGIQLEEDTNVQTWHETVRYFDVQNESGETIGGFYTDLYARKGKRNGAWIDECIVRKKLNGETVLPAGYLVCNFAPPDDNGISLLTHDDVVTTFHEFGHMLHHLLTRIDYPSIAGINGVPWDAVELPSQFMENFAWSYDVLQRASSHFETSEVLPRDLFDKLNRSRHFGAALAMLRQLEFALFDFRLHTEFDDENGTDPVALLKEVREEIALVQHPDYNRLPHGFSHIFAGGYAAGYYSYKWAEVLAADAFSAFEEAGIFDRGTADKFRREILEIGGSRDIMDAFVAFRGRKPTIDALLRYSGIDEAA